MNWSRDELIVAFNLYCKTPFTKINARNKGVKELASIIGRSNSAVALKLANFARLDPALQERNISGMSHGSKGEIAIWDEFSEDWEELSWQSERILAEYKEDSVEKSAGIVVDDLPAEGKERSSLVKTRVNQSFFRKTILASYDNRCCITGISISDLLVAGHIIPWSVDKKNRMNPRNGLCLSALHDKAFDKGLITVLPDFSIEFSGEILENKSPVVADFFLPSKNRKITLPQRFYPGKEFLKYHNETVFRK